MKTIKNESDVKTLFWQTKDSEGNYSFSIPGTSITYSGEDCLRKAANTAHMISSLAKAGCEIILI